MVSMGRRLTLLFVCLLFPGLVGLMNKNMVSSLISQYAQVVLWFCRTGLLPEGSGKTWLCGWTITPALTFFVVFDWSFYLFLFLSSPNIQNDLTVLSFRTRQMRSLCHRVIIQLVVFWEN